MNDKQRKEFRKGFIPVVFFLESNKPGEIRLDLKGRDIDFVISMAALMTSQPRIKKLLIESLQLSDQAEGDPKLGVETKELTEEEFYKG